MQVRNLLSALFGAAILAGTYGCSNKPKEDEFRVYGRIVRERMVEPVPGYGNLYRIDVLRLPDSTLSAYVFIGSQAELDSLNREIDIGDYVRINDETNMITVDPAPVLFPRQIKKVRNDARA